MHSIELWLRESPHDSDLLIMVREYCSTHKDSPGVSFYSLAEARYESWDIFVPFDDYENMTAEHVEELLKEQGFEKVSEDFYNNVGEVMI